MGVYVPPSVRTVRQDIQAGVVITGGQVVPAIIGTAFGSQAVVGGYQAFMAASEIYSFPPLGVNGPVASINQIRSQSSGGIIYVPTVDYVFTSGNQHIDWSADTPLAPPYITSVVEQDGTSSLINGTTYYWVVTATKTLDVNGPVIGETVISNQVSFTPFANNNQAVLNWLAVTGAEGYKVYRTTISGDYSGSALVATLAGGFTNKYIDTGAATTAGSPPGTSTVAKVAAGNAPTYNLSPNETLTISVDGAGAQTATFTATRASRAGTGITYPVTFVGGETLGIRVDGGGTQTIVFTSGSYTLVAVENFINTFPLTGGFASSTGGQIAIESDTQGSGSSIQITGGTALTILGLTAGTTTGTGNVSNIVAVTATEVTAVIAAEITGVTAIVNTNGRPEIHHLTAGATHSVQVTGGTANGIIGFDTSLHDGASAVAGTALRRPAINSGSGHGGAFYVDYQFVQRSDFAVQRFTDLNKLIATYGVGSNLAIAGTLIMGTSGKGNNASICLAMSVPDNNVPTYQAALDILSRRKDVDLVVPCSVGHTINTSLQSYCDTMSDVDHKREQIGLVGPPIGTPVGDETTAGTAIYEIMALNDKRMAYCYPWPICTIQDQNANFVDTELDGWATAAVVAGRIASLPDRAEPATTKQVFGIKQLGIELTEPEENLLGAAGGLVVTLEDSNFIIRDAISTTTDNQADQQLNITLTDDLLRKTLRANFKQFRGRKLLPGLLDQIEKKTAQTLDAFVKLILIAGYDPLSINAVQDDVVLTKVKVYFSYSPIFPTRIIEFDYSFDLQPAALAA